MILTLGEPQVEVGRRREVMSDTVDAEVVPGRDYFITFTLSDPGKGSRTRAKNDIHGFFPKETIKQAHPLKDLCPMSSNLSF